jgi:hypothetical protein
VPPHTSAPRRRARPVTSCTTHCGVTSTRHAPVGWRHPCVTAPGLPAGAITPLAPDTRHDKDLAAGRAGAVPFAGLSRSRPKPPMPATVAGAPTRHGCRYWAITVLLMPACLCADTGRTWRVSVQPGSASNSYEGRLGGVMPAGGSRTTLRIEGSAANERIDWAGRLRIDALCQRSTGELWVFPKFLMSLLGP